MGQKRKAIDIVIYIILTIIGICTLFPIYFMVVNSFKGQKEIIGAPLSLPKTFDFSYIQKAIEEIHLFRALLVTALVTVCAVALIVIVSSLAAWVMVRSKSKLSGILFLIFTAAMLIPFQSVMYPLISFMDTLGLKNIGGLIIMHAGFGLSFSVFLYHGFLKSVPVSLEEAAVIDGANIFQVFFRVVFPLVKSTTITVIILNAVAFWNDYLLPFLVIGNTEYKTLTLELYYAKSLAGQYGNPWELIIPAVMVSAIPIIIIFLLLQKQFIGGIADGAVKG